MFTKIKEWAVKAWEFIKKPFVWLKKQWDKLEAWLTKKAPGVKTFLVTALGAVGSWAASMQEYLSGVPLDKLVKAEQALIVTAVLFTLAFWTRRLSR
jgi:hypothetical protein